MQYVAKQRCVHLSSFNGKVSAVELPVVNRRFGLCVQVNSNHLRSKQGRQVVRDETVAAANIEDTRVNGNVARDLQRHVVSAAHLPSTPFAPPTASKSFQQATAIGVQSIVEHPWVLGRRFASVGR